MLIQRVYETTFIVTPDLQPSEYQQIVEKFNKILTDNGATVSHQEIWGLRKLAYEINRKQSGYYVFTEYRTANEDLNKKLDTEYGYDERIIRHLTIRNDRDAIAYNEKRKAKIKDGVTKNPERVKA
jgi:small subunit ribosomal protein S6